MNFTKAIIAVVLAVSLVAALCACSKNSTNKTKNSTTSSTAQEIEAALNLKNNGNQEWTYDSNSDTWILSVVTAVVNPEIEDEQGVSVCVPGAYVKGIDTNGDGTSDITSESVNGAVKGSLVIDYDAKITSTNGQIYSASTCPVILNLPQNLP